MLSAKILFAASTMLSAALPFGAAHSQTFKVVYQFTGGADGLLPQGGVLYRNGFLYGSTEIGGTHDFGTIYKIDLASGTKTTLENFESRHVGVEPRGGLIEVGGLLYGSLPFSRAYDGGAVLRTNPKTGFTTAVTGFIAAQDGDYPGKLVYANDTLFGATGGDGSGTVSDQGSLFAINRATGAKTTIYQFTGGTDGSTPNTDITMQNGVIYGVTQQGGTFGGGALFAFDTVSGKLSILATFNQKNTGASGVIYHDGILYGTTSGGGKTNNGSIYRFNLHLGTYTTLYSFSGKPDGADPYGQLTYHDGMLYGLSVYGGTEVGTLFQFDLSTKTETVLHNFSGGAQGGLTYVSGTLYGVLTDPNEVFALTP